jgi:HD-GYP domain-containing protein (c-di-GMP phosphodiesterase class II)
MSLEMTSQTDRAFGGGDRPAERATEVAGRPDAGPSLATKSSVLVFLENLADEIDRRQSSEGHSRDMSRWAELVALELDLDDERQWACSTAARLHAVGKVVVPETILNKKGPLSPEEWELIQSHPDRGADLVHLAPGFEKVASIIREHQERFDGTGYPGGKSAIGISLEARIVAVCGAWAAMRATRPYRAALSREQARSELESGSASEFDPEVVRAFLLLEAAEEWNRSSETTTANV